MRVKTNSCFEFRMKFFGGVMKEWSEEKTEESKDRAGRKVSF